MSNINNGVDILNLAERRMSYLQNRQSVLAGNVANVNTPNYKAKDVGPFQGIVDNQRTTMLERTNPMHLSGNSGTAHTHITGGRSSLDKNHVVLEDQLAKITDNSDQQRFASSAYGRYMGMYGMALGSSGN